MVEGLPDTKPESLLGRVLTVMEQLHPALPATLLFVLALAMFSWRLEEAPIYRTMEGREALVVQEIVRSGNWILPLRNGNIVPSKPPFFHWLGALTSLVAGEVSERTVRLPSAFFSAVGVVLVFLLGRRLVGQGSGFLASLLLLTTPTYVEMGREAWVDATFSFFTLLAFTAFYLMYESGRWQGWLSYVFSLAIACTVLSKGPIGYILPSLSILIFLLTQQQAKTGERDRLETEPLDRDYLPPPSVSIFSAISNLCLNRSFPLAFLIPALWYGLALWQGGEAFFDKQIWQENFRRFFAGAGKHKEPLYFFILPFLQGGFPWSLLFLWGVRCFFRSSSLQNKAVYPLVWWLAIFGFFSFSAGKRDVYLLPLYPAMVLLAAGWGWKSISSSRPLPLPLRRYVWWIFGGISFLFLAFFALAAAGVITPDSYWVDTLFGRRKWSHVALPLTLVNQHPLYGLLLAALLCICFFFTIRVILQGRWQEGMAGLLILLLLYYGGAYPFIRGYYKQSKAVKAFALEVAKTVGPEDLLYAYELPELSQIYFYLQRRILYAPCPQIEGLPPCPPGYYLLWEKVWEEKKDKLAGKATEVIRSRTLSGPAAQAHIVLIRLEHLVASRSP
jgi:4-amino-4-deoxy-L-arabinose transferase-like glycosyltransferase